MPKSLKILSLKILKVLKWWLNVFPQEKKRKQAQMVLSQVLSNFQKKKGVTEDEMVR